MTYATKGEVVRIATGKVKVLAVELELSVLHGDKTLGGLALVRTLSTWAAGGGGSGKGQ